MLIAATLLASCEASSISLIDASDAATERDADGFDIHSGVDVQAPSDAPSMDALPPPLDPPALAQACVAIARAVGRGVGPGRDRCEGYVPPVLGVGPTWCSLGSPVAGVPEPEGFCVRKFARNAHDLMPRQLAFAPNGDLFVASPNGSTGAGDSTEAGGAIYVLSDDDRDGTAEKHTFLDGVRWVHGMAFSADRTWLYFTTPDAVYRTPYRVGLRAEVPGSRELITGDGDATTATLQRGRWTHGLAISVNDRVLVSKGEAYFCSSLNASSPSMGEGAIYEVGPHVLNRVALGFRNPMYLRCHPCRDVCLAAELGLDQTRGAVEKFVLIDGERWYGHPCCDISERAVGRFGGQCSCIAPSEVEMPVGLTPFGFDWERGVWPEPLRNNIFVALHGTFYDGNFGGAGLVMLPTNPATGRPTGAPPQRFFNANNQPSPEPRALSRPSDVAFAPDGRLFVGDDHGHGIYWISPITLRMPN